MRCVLRIAADLPECSEDRLPAAVERRVTQASNLIDHGAVQRNPTKARKLVRKAAKALKKGASRAATAGMKGKLSMACGSALSGILREGERRAEQLAATL